MSENAKQPTSSEWITEVSTDLGQLGAAQTPKGEWVGEGRTGAKATGGGQKPTLPRGPSGSAKPDGKK